MSLLSDIESLYLHRDVVDFRKSINGLVVIVEQDMQLSPFSDALFVFTNKARDKLKILYWDRTGFALWYKRLDKERFKWPSKIGSETLSLSHQQLQWLLQGFEVMGHQQLDYQSTVL
ncbi:MAG: IS66 family insertion sequence element accessory protein TnpB [Rhodobacteraceae bacterium]|nr:IS66 family insertion sequence element accessory protein TnpB [Paracoccaceae bacterium]